MAVIQSTYAATMRPGLPGMVANAEDQNVITRTNSGTGAIGFGIPVIRVGDHNCIIASQETLEGAGANGVPPPAGATISAVTVGAGAKEGTYNVVAVVGGAGALSKWEVEDPQGNIVGIASGNTLFSQGGLSFTITDAGADPVVGEAFVINVTPTVGTADLDVLGISVRDPSLDVGATDTFAQYASVPIMTEGVIWVMAGGNVASGGDVFWDPATGRYTVATGLALPGWKYDMAGTNGNVVKIAHR